MKHLSLLILASIIVTGCGYVPRAGGSKQLVAEPSTVDLMLAEAADRSTRALETLAAMEQEQLPNKPIAQVPNAPQELQRGLTFEWTGPVEPLVQEITRKVGYRYGILGNVPVTPILIEIKATNKPAINVLRDIGIQMGARADLKVDAQMRAIEIQYNDLVNRDIQP